MRRVRDQVDAITFLCDVPAEFTPVLNHEHDRWGWFDPQQALDEEQAVLDAMADAVDGLADSVERLNT
jgi:hypothetical protein